jgi:hypothetical protein
METIRSSRDVAPSPHVATTGIHNSVKSGLNRFQASRITSLRARGLRISQIDEAKEQLLIKLRTIIVPVPRRVFGGLYEK